MGVDVKEIGIMLWQILGSSMNISIKFMRNHPIFSGVTMFLLMLYILLPSLLYFLIYSSPVLACVVVYAREKIGLRFSGSQSVTEKSISSSDTKIGGEKTVARSLLRQQRSVRRNARMKVEEWDSQTSEEEKDKVILTSLYNDLLGRTPHFEESPKAIEADVVVVDNEKAFNGDDSSQNLENLGFSSRDLGGLDGENSMGCSCKEDEYGELEGKEDTREEMSNVNEHGISEIERNRRLESLMARRRARRLFRLALDQRNKIQAEETSSPTHNNNVNNNNLQIPFMKNRNNGVHEKRRNYHPSENSVGLQMPGSAPSVLLPGRNPFDIPYDPQEERPNLTGDSFDEEFSVFNQKDMFFCRHESFCRFALFSPEPSKCLNSPAFASDRSMPRKHLGFESEYMQKRPFKGKEVTIGVAEVVADDDGSVESGNSSERVREMNEETDSDKEEGDDSSCSEESETELSRMNKTELGEAISHSMENYSGFLVNQTRNSIPSPFPRGLAPRPDDNNMFYTRRCANSHGRTFSIASDMQVEVSELGSPPTTVDWHDDWSNGGESYIYDTDIDREITRGEELQKTGLHQHESTSGIESKEENTNHLSSISPVDKHDQKCMVDEEYKLVNDKLLLDEKSQTEVAEQRPSSSIDVFNSGNSGKFEGLLFHTSASLSSITEEPETILDPINGENPENIDQRSLTFPDSLENNELDGSHKIMDSEIKDLILDNIQDDHDSDINKMTHGETKPEEFEVTQKVLDPSLDTFSTESLESEVLENKEPNFGQFTDDLKSSLGDTVTEFVESEVMEENGPNLVEDTDEEAKPLEEQIPHEVLKPQDSTNAENASDVMVLQVQDGDNSRTDESNDQEISMEGENSVLNKDLDAKSVQEDSNTANSNEESVISSEIQISQDSQEVLQSAVEHEDEITQNTQILEVKLEHEAKEKEIEFNLESLHQSMCLVAKEVDEECKKDIEAMHNVQNSPRDENRDLQMN